MMRTKLNVTDGIFPMPVLMIATYNEDGSVNVMNAAWGTMIDSDVVALNLSETHKTVQNIKARGAFTVSFGDAAHAAACDYVGLVSANDTPDKMERAGFHTVKSEFVDAPVIEELPVTLECRRVKIGEDGHVIGQIVNVSAEESVLGEDGAIDAERFAPLAFDPARNVYRKIGGAAGKAFADGYALQ